MAATYLDSIVAAHRQRAAIDSRDWRQRTVATSGAGFEKALREHRDHGNAVIAEVKRSSPSKGALNVDLDPETLARAYVAGGASAISVLTDVKHFGGSVADLDAVHRAVDVPILRKDFTVSVNDVLDTAEMGASCVLLIVAALTSNELHEYFHVSREIGLDALIEVHDEHEAAQAIDMGATLIGVNQRDLHTFEVDAERAQRVAASLPGDVVRVAESGFHRSSAVREAAAAGFDAVLVGEAFVTSDDPAAMVRSFVGFDIGGGR